MMSLTTSLGRPFSAESCASPVTSSRFMARLPLSSLSRMATKKVGRPTFQSQTQRPARPNANDNYTKREGRQCVGAGGAAAPLLGEVISDAREVVLELIAEENHRDDDGYRDDRDDECVLD